MKAIWKSSTSAMLGIIACLTSASAEPVKGVVELFTSQSCSSCPPADKILGSLIMRDGIIGLAYHVDYWDYLDWKDTFSSKDATSRQYSYATTFQSSQVYTPQLIVNGSSVVKSGSPDKVFALLDEMKNSNQGLKVSVNAQLTQDRLSITAGKGSGAANLVLVVYKSQTSVAMTRGENRGKTIDYHNAVTGIHTIGMWKGDALTVELPRREYLKENGYGSAILLQRVTDKGSPGEIIGAAIITDTSG